MEELTKKQRAIHTTGDYLQRVAVATTRYDRVRLSCDLYDEMIRQPILVANNPFFRRTTLEKLHGLRDELKEGDDPELVARYQWIIARRAPGRDHACL